MRRRLRQFLAIVCTAILLLAIAAWIASYYSTITLVVYRSDFPRASDRPNDGGPWRTDRCFVRGLYTQSAWGGLLLRFPWEVWREPEPGEPPRPPWRFAGFFDPPSGLSPIQKSKPNFLGIQLAGQPYTGRELIDRTCWIVLPYWAIVIVLIPVPLISMIRVARRRRRLSRRLCPECGYDVRASTGQCPECGTVIPAAAPPGKPECSSTNCESMTKAE